MEEPGSPDYAKQQFNHAVYALIGASPIDRRLTSAASYLNGDDPFLTEGRHRTHLKQPLVKQEAVITGIPNGEQPHELTIGAW